MKQCKICGKQTVKNRKTCSYECLIESRRLCGKQTIDQNRQSGENHYLWKGGKINRSNWIKQDKAKNPDKWSARQKIADAKRRGKLKAQPCEVCGDTKSEAHHPDYSDPLNIQWLCRKHHREADKRDGHAGGDF